MAYHEVFVQLFLPLRPDVLARTVDEILIGQMNDVLQFGITFPNGQMKIVEFIETTIRNPFERRIIVHGVQRFARHGYHIDSIFFTLLTAHT